MVGIIDPSSMRVMDEYLISRLVSIVMYIMYSLIQYNSEHSNVCNALFNSDFAHYKRISKAIFKISKKKQCLWCTTFESFMLSAQRQSSIILLQTEWSGTFETASKNIPLDLKLSSFAVRFKPHTKKVYYIVYTM